MTRTLLAVLLAGLIGGPVTADDPVTIKVRRPAKGEVVKVTKTDDGKATVEAKKGADETKKDVPTSSKAVYTDEVKELQDGDKRPTKLTRKYEAWEQTREGKKTDLELAGKTVVIAKAFTKWTFEVDGKAVGGEAAELLNKEFNEPDSDDLLLPKKAVKAGDTWEPDGKLVAKAFADDLKVDADKVKATAKLLKVYDQDKAKYGQIEYIIVLPVKAVPLEDGKSADALPGSKVTITLTVDRCLDGTTVGETSTFKVDGKITWTADGTDYTVTSSSTLKTVAEPVKK